MRRWTLWIVIAMTAWCLAGCNTGDAGRSEPTSGVEGIVTYGPLCPVAQAGSPCPDRPWQGRVQVLGLDGVSVEGTTSTDKQGAFSIDLAPGRYLITPLTPDGPPSAKLRHVTVMTGAYTSVELSVDSGIR